MNNAVGAARVLEMLNKGILVGIGSDGMTPDISEEIRVATLLHRHIAGDPRVAFEEIRTVALDNNRQLAERIFGEPLGVLKRGALADIVIRDYVPPTPLHEDNFWGHFLFGLARARARTVLVGGRPVIENGILCGELDEDALALQSRQLAERLWERF
jgi:cytosine/adenosine deaminase-related metal-dependent hydrolase